MKSLRLKLPYSLQSAEADFVCVGAVSTAVLSYSTYMGSQAEPWNQLIN